MAKTGLKDVRSLRAAYRLDAQAASVDGQANDSE
jgi:hypothetical protein